MPSARKPWWQQATALVSLSAGGAITGLSFVPKAAAADMASPASVPIELLALNHAARSAPSGDARSAASKDEMFRSAIVNVAAYYLRMAETKSPAEMEAIIWQHDSLDGADHGASCAAFASLTLELAAQVVGKHSWVTGGTSYPWPLHKWADVRVDPNPASLGIISLRQDAEAHGRWHSLGDGYQPLPGDWVVFKGHVEVVTSYSGGVLHTVGADSLPNFSVNAHSFSDPLRAQGVLGFVNNGGAGEDAGTAQPSPGRAPAATHPREGVLSGLAAVPGAYPTGGPQAELTAQAPGGADIPGTTVTGGAGDPPAPHRPAARHKPANAHRAGARTKQTAPREPDAPHKPTAPRTPTGPHTRARQQKAAAGHKAGGTHRPAAKRQAKTRAGSGQPGEAAVPGFTGTAARNDTGPAGSPVTTHRGQESSPAQAPVSDAAAQQAFIRAVAPGAVAAQRKYGVPAAVTIAQAIEESGWGRSELATKDHNLFGIKGTGPAGSDHHVTREYENGRWVTRISSFRVYHNVAECIDDHGRYLRTGEDYKRAMAVHHIPDAFAHRLTGVYATDPDYGTKLVSLMRRHNLYRFDTAKPAGSRIATPSRDPIIPGVTATAPSSLSATLRPAPHAQPQVAARAQRRSAGRGGMPLTPQPHSAGTGAASSGVAQGMTGGRDDRPSRLRYRPHIPLSVMNAFVATAKVPLTREEPLYRDVAGISGIRWELLAACDWMQCEAKPRYSPVHGEKLGALNPDGTRYRTKSEALEQAAEDLIELTGAVYQIDLTAGHILSVRDLASAFAAFRWGGLLKLHHTSAMEFPYSVAGLTAEHLTMRWPNIAAPNAPDKPGTRFHGSFGAVPIVLALNYPATV